MDLYTQKTEPPNDNWRILAYDEDGDEEKNKKLNKLMHCLATFWLALYNLRT